MSVLSQQSSSVAGQQQTAVLPDVLSADELNALFERVVANTLADRKDRRSGVQVVTRPAVSPSSTSSPSQSPSPPSSSSSAVRPLRPSASSASSAAVPVEPAQRFKPNRVSTQAAHGSVSRAVERAAELAARRTVLTARAKEKEKDRKEAHAAKVAKDVADQKAVADMLRSELISIDVVAGGVSFRFKNGGRLSTPAARYATAATGERVLVRPAVGVSLVETKYHKAPPMAGRQMTATPVTVFTPVFVSRHCATLAKFRELTSYPGVRIVMTGAGDVALGMNSNERVCHVHALKFSAVLPEGVSCGSFMFVAGNGTSPASFQVCA